MTIGASWSRRPCTMRAPTSPPFERLPAGRAQEAAEQADPGARSRRFRRVHRGHHRPDGAWLPNGEIVPKVPFSVFWLIEGDAFIGEANVRPAQRYLIKEGGHAGYGIRRRASARATAS